jgi:tetratricopeptide (TPR) repeat protein
MARVAAVQHGLLACALAQAARRVLGRSVVLGLFLLAFVAALPGTCQAQPVKGEAKLTVSGGYARLIVKLVEDIESQVVVNGNILVIRFKRPVDVPVEKLADVATDYVGSARRDPDGYAIRLALSRKVTVNAMQAGERLFVDLLPDTWSGLPPSLPQDVVKELAERARAAERLLRQQRAADEAAKRPPIRVRASVLPTFVRFVFELPDGVGVSSVLNEKKLALTFNAPLGFDLADAKVSAPPNVASIGSKVDGDTALVEIGLIGDVDVRSFREDRNYIVDIGFQQGEKQSILPKGAVPQVPVAAAAAHDKPSGEAAMHGPGDIQPPTSESIARGSNADKKPEGAARQEPAAKTEPAAKDAPAPKADAGHKAELEPKVEAKVEMAARPEAVAKPEQAAAKVEPAVTVQEPVAKPVAEAAKEAHSPTPVEPPKAVANAPPAEMSSVEAAKPAGTVDAKRSSDGLKLTFSFAGPTPAALFRRGDIVWLVVDAAKPINIEAIRREGGAVIGDAVLVPLPKGQAVRIRLNRPQLASLTPDDPAGSGRIWSIMFADMRQSPSQPLTAIRTISDPAHANVAVALSNAGQMHRLADPDAGDALLVVTALPPSRGFIRRQDFVEFSLLESVHGVAIQLNSDDVNVETSSDKIMISRAGGLTLSSADAAPLRGLIPTRPLFDSEQWKKDQEGAFIPRLDALMLALSQADAGQRVSARLDLARFYMARAMYPEAKGAFELAMLDAKPGVENPVALLGHAAASALMYRPAQTIKDLANPSIGTSYDAQLWKGLAFARQGKWADAREKFKNAEFAIASLPNDLQRVVIAEALRASLEAKDFGGAATRGSELELVGIPPEMKPEMLVLSGRLADALGHEKEAIAAYQEAVASPNRPAAAEAKLLEVMLRQKRNEIRPETALRDLETLAATWRGDALEVKTLQLLARSYADLGKFGGSLDAARTATQLAPNSEPARQAQDEASALFAQIFLGQKGDDLPAVEALALFYENRELTPIGRRGDEMIRRLADRLVGVDLLDQAAELLQYQVDNRLEGAARAQVASKLATVYLMNRKPDRAVAALRSTRIADLAGELRQQRLLLEGRAQSDIGRRDLALDIISNVGGREAIRLRSDIYWAARRWREASEQIELYYADRWRDFTPLNAQEKGDVIRAVVGYALAEDALGQARFREKYAPLMTGADKAAFDTASKPGSASTAEFIQVAKLAGSVDTLEGFLRDMKTRFPETSAKAILPPGIADPPSTGSLPETISVRQIPMTR